MKTHEDKLKEEINEYEKDEYFNYNLMNKDDYFLNYNRLKAELKGIQEGKAIAREENIKEKIELLRKFLYGDLSQVEIKEMLEELKQSLKKGDDLK